MLDVKVHQKGDNVKIDIKIAALPPVTSSDKPRRSRFERQTFHKRKNVAIGKLIKDTSKSKRLKACSSAIAKGNDGKIYGAHCNCRICPVCQTRKMMKTRAIMYDSLPIIIESLPNAAFLFATFTVKNMPVDNLSSTLEMMNKAFSRLLKNPAVSLDLLGYYRAVEVKRAKDGLAHPHFHCLFVVKSSYFMGTHYISVAKWRNYWQQALDVDYLPQVDVRKVYDKNSVMEVIKYTTSSDDLLEGGEEWLNKYDEQMRGKRVIATGGVVKNVAVCVKKAYKQAAKDSSESLVFVERYEFDRKKRKYVKDESFEPLHLEPEKKQESPEAELERLSNSDERMIHIKYQITSK